MLAIMMLSVLLTLGYLTVQDMYSQMHPYVHEVEEGTQNLAAGACEMRAEQIEQAFFYTNNNFRLFQKLTERPSLTVSTAPSSPSQVIL